MPMDEDALKDFVREEVKKALPEKMTDDEKIQNARDIRDIIQQNLLWAEQRSSGIADEFIRLEVQIATIIFAFASLFATAFNGENLEGVSPQGIFMMKLAFSFSIFSLIASLGFGLLHLKTNERFWDRMLNQRIIRFRKWNSVPRREATFEEASAYHEGTTLEKGLTVSVPDWTWVLQTICLGLAITILFVLVVISLFVRQ